MISIFSNPGYAALAIAGASGGGIRLPAPCVVETNIPRLSALVLDHIRSLPNVNATSSAVIVSPLWNFTPSCSRSSTVRSSIRRHVVASPGFGASPPIQSMSIIVSPKL